MWILMVEAGVALFLLVFIVWWTMYQGPKPDQHEPPKLEKNASQDSPDTPPTP